MRLLHAFLAEARQVTTPSIVLAVLFWAANVVFQFIKTGEWPKQDFVSVAIPAIWATCVVACWCLIRSAVMLRRDDIAGWHAWKPALIGTPAPVKPSAAPIIVLTIVSCGFLIAVLYLTSHVPRLQPPTALGKALTDKTSSRKETTSPPEPAGAKAAPPQPTIQTRIIKGT